MARSRGTCSASRVAACRKGGGRIGDLLVQAFIEVPKKLTSRQRELLRELAELEHAHVTPNRKSFLDKLVEYFAPASDKVGEQKEE